MMQYAIQICNACTFLIAVSLLGPLLIIGAGVYHITKIVIEWRKEIHYESIAEQRVSGI